MHIRMWLGTFHVYSSNIETVLNLLVVWELSRANSCPVQCVRISNRNYNSEFFGEGRKCAVEGGRQLCAPLISMLHVSFNIAFKRSSQSAHLCCELVHLQPFRSLLFFILTKDRANFMHLLSAQARWIARRAHTNVPCSIPAPRCCSFGTCCLFTTPRECYASY